jgi:hypothetical protein
MTQVSILIAVGIALLAACAVLTQHAVHMIARARVRRQRRLLVLSSVVTGLPTVSPDDQLS